MFNVCPRCGQYHSDKIIDDKGPYAVCPDCGYHHKFKQLPLFIITGASGSGKSTICLELSKLMTEVIALESDILWRSGFNKPDNDYREYREMWLRVCKNISQSGKPIVLCGSAIPSQFEGCIERRYFSHLYYLALVCQDKILSERLKQRPTWRRSGLDQFIQEQIEFNNWFKQNGANTSPIISLLDTSYDSTSVSAGKIIKWISQKI